METTGVEVRDEDRKTWIDLALSLVAEGMGAVRDVLQARSTRILTMPYSGQIAHHPNGIAVNAASSGEPVTIQSRGFVTTQKGDEFAILAESLTRGYLAALPPDVLRESSTIDHLLIIARPDNTFSLFADELSITSGVRVKRKKKTGEAIGHDEIADILTLQFPGVEIPQDSGIVTILSCGGHKGVFFDFTPLAPGFPSRNFDIHSMLGRLYGYLCNPLIFQITDVEWGRLIAQHWFPFVTLKSSTIASMVSCATNDLPIDNALDPSVAELKSRMQEILERWEASPYFGDHIEVLKRGCARFMEGDFVSAVSILVPRIEGIMRSFYGSPPPGTKITSRGLVASVTKSEIETSFGLGWLLPSRFREYLEKVYFAAFTPGGPTPPSRHSLAHGVVAYEHFSEKSATLAVLTIDQLYYSLPVVPPAQRPTDSTNTLASNP